MYNTELALNPTYDDLINKVTEYDIFKTYIGKDFKLNQIMSSPLRSDKHPSFGIFKSKSTNSLLFKDQATGDTGNCIHLVMKLFSLTYYAAINKVWREVITNNISKSTIGKDIDNYKATDTVILVNKRNFSKTDDEYWNQFGITRDDLKEYNIFPINYFITNDVLQPFRYTTDNPMYAYFIFNKVKIYRPKANKDEKWRTNAGMYDIQGYEQLPDKIEHLIITKSLKDIIVLRKLGYYAIAPNGENHDIPKSIINKLIQDKDVKRFTIFYDNDEAGIKASAKLLDKFSTWENTFFKNIRLDYSLANTLLASRCGNQKDISDYVKEYGLEKAKEWIKQNL